MHYTGTTIRPPYEAYSLLLQVTTGCSHNACTFCSIYQDECFGVSPWDEVEADIAEAARVRPDTKRVFLENGDAFCLPAEHLLEVAAKLKESLPNVREISGYARIQNIATKTDEELRALAEAGFMGWNVGIESGMDDVLAFMNKGYDVATAREQLLRLNAAGLPFSLNIIIAAAGPDRMAEHAAANAAIVNETQPYLVFVSPLHVDPGTPLEGMRDRGEFVESTLGQYIDEEIDFLRQLEMRDCIFFGTHISNPIGVAGRLPEDKQALIDELIEGKDEFPEYALNSHPSKGREGFITGW